MDELAAYLEEVIVLKVIKCCENEDVGLMLAGKKTKTAMNSSGLCYETGQSQYRSVCKRAYRKKKQDIGHSQKSSAGPNKKIQEAGQKGRGTQGA